MKISERLEAVHQAVLAAMEAGDLRFANNLQDRAVDALWGGIRSEEWRIYMSTFASNPGQLSRLTGNDQTFNNTAYGFKTLAYMAANGTCGPTTDTYTGRTVDEGMLADLDRDLETDDEPMGGLKKEQSATAHFLNGTLPADFI